MPARADKPPIDPGRDRAIKGKAAALKSGLPADDINNARSRALTELAKTKTGARAPRVAFNDLPGRKPRK